MKNKRGWLKIVEAFIALLMIIGVVLLLINKGYFGNKDVSDKVYGIESTTLKEIERDDSLRAPIFLASIGVESHKSDGSLNLGNGPGQFPVLPWNRIDDRILKKYTYLDCRAKICDLTTNCGLNVYPEGAKGKNVYSQPVAITANSAEYNPRQLKLFCWEK